MSLVAYSDDSDDEEVCKDLNSSLMEKSDTAYSRACANIISDSDCNVEVVCGKNSQMDGPDSSPKDSNSELGGGTALCGKDSDSESVVETSGQDSNTSSLCVNLDSDSDSVVEISGKITGESSPPMENPDSGPKESSEGLGGVSVSGGKDRSHLFSSLPCPVTTSSDVDLERQEVKDCSKGYERKPVKIPIPSLDFETEEKEVVPNKKRKVMPKGSRLFALLPPPKTVPVKEAKRSLVPNVLTKKASTSTVRVKPQIDGKHEKLPGNIRPHQANNSDSGEDSGGEEFDPKSKDFFSLSEVDNKDNTSEETIDVGSSSGNSGDVQVSLASSDNSSSSGSYQPPSQWTTFLPDKNYETSSPAEHFTRAVTEPNVASSSAEQPVTGEGLPLEEAFKCLGGTKYKRQMQEIEVIDINEDTIMPDSNEWLTKQLTVETNTKIHGHSHRKNDGPTTQQRRKHQITYLAFQAKEKELELKNQWSQNRMSRKQTQSKYGF